jgi:hypothetical protein
LSHKPYDFPKGEGLKSNPSPFPPTLHLLIVEKKRLYKELFCYTVNQFNVTSYHRFLITTNNEDPITTKNDDRRNLVIRSSDEKKGDKEYFKIIHDLLKDVDVIKTYYEYFMNIPDVDVFYNIPVPVTEYQNDMKEISLPAIERW